MNNEMLIKILSDDNRLVMPGFGAILSKSEDNERIYVFSPFLKKDDGKLREAVSREYGVDQHDAESMIQEYVAHVESVLESGGRFRIPSVGVLVIDENGVVVMQKDVDSNVNQPVASDSAKSSDQMPKEMSGNSGQRMAPSIDFNQESIMRSAQDRVVDMSNIGVSSGRARNFNGGADSDIQREVEKVHEVVIEREVVVESSSLASESESGALRGADVSGVGQRSMANSSVMGQNTASSSSVQNNKSMNGSQPRSAVAGGTAGMVAGHNQKPVVRQVVSRPVVGASSNSGSASPRPMGSNVPNRGAMGGPKPMGVDVNGRASVNANGTMPNSEFRSSVANNANGRANNAAHANMSAGKVGAANKPAMGQSVGSTASAPKVVRARRSADSLDVWLIVAIIAAAVALGLMIYGYVVSNQTVDVEPLTQIELLDDANAPE